MEKDRRDDLVEWVGAIHMHSRHSDGRGTVDQILDAAERHNLDFCILTDHDTLAGLPREGYNGRVLLLVGCEVTCANDGHLLAIGIRQPIPRGLPPQQAIDAVHSGGGLALLAHPFDRGSPLFRTHYPWKDWSVHDYEGLEIWNFLVDWAEGMRNPLRAAVAYLVLTLRLRGPNPAGLATWDALNVERFTRGQAPLTVIGGVDAHGYFTYHRSLATVRTHLWAPAKRGTDEADRHSILKALRGGKMFAANDGLHDATGFRFEVTGADGRGYPEGRADVRGPASVRVVSPTNGYIRIVHNGDEVYEEYGTHAEFLAKLPGTYRCEVWLKRWGRMRPWIFSNAVHVRMA